MKDSIQYWYCCGSTDPLHRREVGGTCLEVALGYPEHCRFGTLESHIKWERFTHGLPIKAANPHDTRNETA